MDTLIHKVAALAYVDKQIGYLHDEFGDLPEQIENQKTTLESATKMVNETDSILSELKQFIAKAKTTLVDLKTKEENLAKQQFQVRNNKEFDAITSEIKHLNTEHADLADKLRQESIKEENLSNILDKQKTDLHAEKIKLEELEKELAEVSSEQDGELKDLNSKREKIVSQIDEDTLAEYNRIRTYHKEAAVQVVRGSCRGYKIPSQKLVEIRNNMDQIYVDEHTGRILIPEEISVDEALVNSVA
jgi:predicted  nucleic acid-binding Zn-ribbon protein